MANIATHRSMRTSARLYKRSLSNPVVGKDYSEQRKTSAIKIGLIYLPLPIRHASDFTDDSGMSTTDKETTLQ